MLNYIIKDVTTQVSSIPLGKRQSSTGDKLLAHFNLQTSVKAFFEEIKCLKVRILTISASIYIYIYIYMKTYFLWRLTFGK